jgi:hypothetical protein
MGLRGVGKGVGMVMAGVVWSGDEMKGESDEKRLGGAMGLWLNDVEMTKKLKGWIDTMINKKAAVKIESRMSSNAGRG